MEASDNFLFKSQKDSNENRTLKEKILQKQDKQKYQRGVSFFGIMKYIDTVYTLSFVWKV